MPEDRSLLSTVPARTGGHAGPAAAPVPAPTTSSAGHQCPACTSYGDHDEWNADVRGETPLQRADRAYSELLQEVRVAQTGVQILFAFLLTLAFTNRFAVLSSFGRLVYVVTLLLCAAATALLIAPAAFHRIVYRRRLKQHLLHVANRLALSGLVLLVLAMTSAILLILDVVVGLSPALFLTLGALSWFVAWWFILPVWSRVRHKGLLNRAADDDGHPNHGGFLRARS